MTDAQEIANLKQSTEHDLPMFTDKQWLYLSDYNNGSYQSQIQFDTNPTKDQWITWRDTYLAIPLKVQSAAGTHGYTSSTPVAIKASLLSLIYGLVINTGSGQSIVNDMGVNFINNIRLLIEKSLDWVNSEGQEIMFAKDTANTVNEQQYAITGGNVTGNNANYNAGFATRITLLQQSSSIVSNVLYFTAIIPLRLLHDFFEQLDFPLINTRFQMNFLIAFGASSNYYPTQVSSATANTDAATVSIGGGIGNCRIYYPKITFDPRTNAEMASKLAHGYKKRFEFLCTDFYPLLVNNSASTISQIISQSTVKPVRVWALLYPTGTLNQANQQSASPLCATGQLTSANLMINGQNYFSNPFILPYEFWQEIREQFPNGGESNTLGSMLNYSDFLSNYRYHCFDISRVKDRLKSPNDAISIQLMANRAEGSPAAMDYVFLVERITAVSFHISSSDVQIMVGPNA